VYQVLQDTDADYLPGKKDILDFLEQKKNYMTNPLNGRKKDLVKLISRENDKLPLYRWDELRDLILRYKVPPGSVSKLTGEAIYEDGKSLANLWVGRQGCTKTIIEDIKSGEWRTRKYYVNPGKRPPRGRKENWITSKEFAELVDKYGFSLSRE
jgi:hypothetical protein